MTIGEVARIAGLPTKTVRYYADIGLVAPEGRSATGYRLYDAAALRRLVFIRRARAFGFSIEECRELLLLYDDQQRSSADVKRLASAHVAALDRQMQELSALRDELAHLVASCHGDGRPDCPILSGLAGSSPNASPGASIGENDQGA
ncbi:MAG: Cu(I)-responsive transcriptional regulator [Neomegalonema sp.]|nr:Cu(I)-responsive transcriptional regulator [Neomegalonema sp.]